MILQALTRCYEDLLALEVLPPPGWAMAKVSWAAELGADGTLAWVCPLQREETRGGRTVRLPQNRLVPRPVKKTSGVAANFLYGTASYLLGADAKGKPDRTARCFAAAAALHRQLLAGARSAAARAILAFFDRWDPAAAPGHPALRQDWAAICRGGNLLFWYDGAPVTGVPEIRDRWQQALARTPGDAPEGFCLVTGRREPLARIHPAIQGVAGAQGSGTVLVSFNAPAFCSYGHAQGANAPISRYAAFAYTTALNHLLADREHVLRAGDTTLVCWAAGGRSVYQEFALEAFWDNNTLSWRDLRNALFRLADGLPVDWNEQRLDPDTPFYVLGLAPNAGRLAVRFFWQNSFAVLARNVSRHHRRLEIGCPAREACSSLSVQQLLRETVNEKGCQPEPNPRLAGELLPAILNDAPYPAALLGGVALRIRADRKITRRRAAILKAWYLRNGTDKTIQEVMTVQSNDDSRYPPYLLGHLFSVLETIQQKANGKTTLRDNYFLAASATPATVFPLLINLAQKYLARMDGGLAAYYRKRIAGFYADLPPRLPARLTLPEQSAFQVGYYHETLRRYPKKEEEPPCRT